MNYDWHLITHEQGKFNFKINVMLNGWKITEALVTMIN